MDKFIAVVFMIVAIVVIVCGEMYFRLERTRVRASTFMTKLKPSLLGWMETAAALFGQSGGEFPARYEKLAQEFSRIPDKNLYKHAGLINEIHDLAKEAVAENLENPAVISWGRKLTEKALYLSFPQDDFNTEAVRLNRQLENYLMGFVGKIMRIEKLELLDDLSVLELSSDLDGEAEGSDE